MTEALTPKLPGGRPFDHDVAVELGVEVSHRLLPGVGARREIMKRWTRTMRVAMAALALGVAAGCVFGNGNQEGTETYPPDTAIDVKGCGYKGADCCRGAVCHQGRCKGADKETGAAGTCR